MLKRIIFVMVLATALPAAAPVFANPISDAVVLRLQQQGYDTIDVRRTLLGRIHITATNQDYRRELVVHPITGQVMRDRWVVISGAANLPAPTKIDLDDGGPKGEEGHGGDEGGHGEGESGGGDSDNGDSGDGGGESGGEGESGDGD